MKKCVLEQGKTIFDNDVYRLIGEWKAVYDTAYGHKITDESWKSTNIYTWLMNHFILAAISKNVSYDD